MVLVFHYRIWTFGLYILCFLSNMIIAKSFNADKEKELLFVSDENVIQKNYRFEDFFWSGSGDGPITDNLFNNNTESEISYVEASSSKIWQITTVFHTTSILFATVYPPNEGCLDYGCTPEISLVQTESTEFSLRTFPTSNVPNILPSSTPNILITYSTAFTNISFKESTTGLNISAFESSETTRLPSTKSTFFPSSVVTQSTFTKTDVDTYNAKSTTMLPDIFSDEKYWILTVLRNNNYSQKLEVNAAENRLSSLYKKAFVRRQDRFDFRRNRKLAQSVKAHILNVTNDENKMKIIYLVTVGGSPIPAISAANDMRLLTPSEVIAELGFPVLAKAEPYSKGLVPLEARVKGRTRDTWLLIGSVIAAILLLMILAAFFALGLSKKRTERNTTKGQNEVKQAFQEEGNSNLAFEGEVNPRDLSKDTPKGQLKTENSKTVKLSSGAMVKFNEGERRGSTSSSSCSGSSEASLVRLRHQQKKKERKKEETEEKPKPKLRTRLKRIESCDGFNNLKRYKYVQSGSSAISKNTLDEITTEGFDDIDYSPHITRSPTSYLSMPSVKAFPRGTKIPEPLNKILEPTIIRHLDADSDSNSDNSQCNQEIHQRVEIEQVCEMKNKFPKRKTLTRHASLEGDDPGVLGPVVWSKHCRKITEGVSDLVNIEEPDEAINVGKMRKRFNELLDDALSMFGSRNGSPEENDTLPVKQPDNRIHSAVVRPALLSFEETGSTRPKTTGSKRPQSSEISGPRGAWETPSSSTIARPVSAGAFPKLSPTIDRNLIYVNSHLPPNDPAIPVISAIKKELKKFEGPVQ